MTQTTKNYDNLSTKKLDKSRTEITNVWEKFRAQALKNLNEQVTIDGFRKGMVPENILISKVGEMPILEEMAELALSKAYVNIILDSKIDAIGKPQIQLTKIAKDIPLEFTATTAVMPTVVLADYKKIAGEMSKPTSDDKIEITEQEIEDAILKIRKSRVSHEGHDHAGMSAEDHEKSIMENLPDLSDDFIKSLGDFKDISDFKNKVSEMLSEEKKDAAREKRRIKIADALNDGSQIELPDIMIESELHRMEQQFESDIERMNVKLEAYLKHAKKTIDDLRAEWRPHAEKKAKLQLILNEIAREEKITPDPKEIEEEVSHIVEHYKEADRERAAVYAETVLTNEKVFKWLEK
jgi:FKBP-type peptidyl-prolyl cis-trans isomerase (trigger factor)